MTELERIRELVAGHTPGPWLWETPTEDWMVPTVLIRSENGKTYYRVEADEKDAKLIAHATSLLRIATEQAKRIEELELRRDDAAMIRRLGEQATRIKELEREYGEQLRRLIKAKERISNLEAAFNTVAIYEVADEECSSEKQEPPT